MDIKKTKLKRPQNSTTGDIRGLGDIIGKFGAKKVVKFSAVFAKDVPKNKRKNPKADK